nr:hypothetical protein [uncultured Mediterranean phage uvMED]
MNYLRNFAGLLNQAAPEGEFLAYINNDEAEMLKDAGGAGLLTPQGIPSYFTAGQRAGDSISPGTSTSGGMRDSGGGGRDFSTVSAPAGGASKLGNYGGNSSGGKTANEMSGGGDGGSVDPSVTPTSNFDYETEANTGVGKIESNFFNPETGEFSLKQTAGVIPAVDYQTSNIGAYLDSPGVTDKDKTDFLGRLKAISNSDLVGTNVDGIEDDFVINNLDTSLESIIDQTKYSKYTSNIDEVAKTFESDLKNTPLSTIAKSGGIIGTFFRGVTDNYKNNKAMDLLGYTGSTIKYNPDGSGNFNYDGEFLTGNPSQGERDAVNQLTPLAAYFIGGTTPQESMVNKYFANMGSNLGVSPAYLNTYNAAKDKISQSLNLTPNTQQYGFGNIANDNFARTMTSANPFFDELTNQGLI